MAPTSEDEEINKYSLAKERSRRDKSGSKAKARADLLAKIKNAKVCGTKYVQQDTDDDLYEMVDEEQYAEIVRKRKEDNWIVGDGDGYEEDGREIFDEEHREFGDDLPRKKGEKKKNPNIQKPGSTPSITSMFASSAAKGKLKPKKEVKEHDDILEELLARADGGPEIASSAKTASKRKQPLPLFTKKPASTRPLLTASSESGQFSASSSSPCHSNLPNSLEERKASASPMACEHHSADSGLSAQFDDDLDEDALMELATAKPEKRVKTEMDMSSSWMSSEGETKPYVSVTPAEPPSSIAGLPVVNKSDSGEQVFRFYWLDAHEDYFKHPGTIYLFGKTRSTSGDFVSCCVTIKQIYRQIFLLPREHRYDSARKELTDEPLAFIDVYNEFNQEIAPKFKIQNYKTKPSTRQYSFDLSDVPTKAEYLEVRYGCEYPALPKDLFGETFSHVFGTNKSSLELFLLEQKIKGPCWLDITQPKASPYSVSWCKYDVLVTNLKTVSVLTEAETLPAPPLVTLTMSVKSAHNSQSNQNEVVQVACLVNTEYHVDRPSPDKYFHHHFLAVSKTSDLVYPLNLAEQVAAQGAHLKMEILASERALLGFLLAKVHKYDPDILIGHDISNFELDLLLNRVSSNKVPHWHKISRLKRSGDVPRKAMGKSMQVDRSAMCGRIICDTMISARELIRAKSYDLSELVLQLLQQKREEVDVEELKASYSDSKELMRVANLTIQDAFYAHKLLFELNILPLAWQITSICGNILSRTLLGGRSERNEYLLLHAFSERGFIVPDKMYASKSKNNKRNVGSGDGDMNREDTTPLPTRGKNKPAYAGGLVLEPKKGFYDTFILLLDFNSLYPSIIQEYNVCFTTVNKTLTDQTDDMVIPDIPDSSLAPGILPVEIRKLVQSRRQVKALMKDKNLSKEQYMQYDIRQKALKLTANSMYGCLGFTFSRFYAKPLAALITAKGREILQKTKELVEKMGLEVIYGDTDSIMINSNSNDFEEVYKLGNKVKSEVNKTYRLLEIDIDGVYKSMLLLKKKKYAALNVSKGPDGHLITSQELKGLDIVRRDWCELSKQTGLYVVNEILSGGSKETVVENIHSKLREVKEAVNGGEIPLDLFYITKQLTKPPDAYPDKKSLPHVQVALRLNTSAARKLRAGDTVYYIICQDGTSLAASQRAYHPDELARNDSLKIDTEYYLAHQVHPVVSRLCDPMEGTDSVLLAEMLGLDASRYHHKVTEDDGEEEARARLLSDDEKYKHCRRLEIICQSKGCGRKNIIDSPVQARQGKRYDASWENCASLNPDGSPNHKLHLSTLNREGETDLIYNNVSLLKNKLSVAIRSHVAHYYQGWLYCEDSACGHRTRRISLRLYRGRPMCPGCNKAALVQEYTESELYDQLCFYKYLFDVSKRPKSDQPWASSMLDLYSDLTKFIDSKLASSAYGHIDLHKLFSRIVMLGNASSETCA
ncbi:DNA polymerase alpha catalytic subunit-like [Watersipora subatra]|uniref:DNA polymerase alpha catalytic subunit-like n=1 Tax=Watersipora subatra TaxID=2589382 RepID=UPI00355B33CC